MNTVYKPVTLDRMASQSIYDYATDSQRLSNNHPNQPFSHGPELPFAVEATQSQNNQCEHLSVMSTPSCSNDDQYPSYAEIEVIIQEYLDNLSSKKRDKALIDRDRYMLILQVLKRPKNTAISTAQFRFWVKKMFRLVSCGGNSYIYHDDKPVATREDIYGILLCAHNESRHGGRDKTSVLVRQRYSWIPKELIARFVRSCPVCILKRNGSQSPTLGFPRTPSDTCEPVQTMDGFVQMETHNAFSKYFRRDHPAIADEEWHRQNFGHNYQHYNQHLNNHNIHNNNSDNNNNNICLYHAPTHPVIDGSLGMSTSVPAATVTASSEQFAFGPLAPDSFDSSLYGHTCSESNHLPSTFGPFCNTCQPAPSDVGYTAEIMNASCSANTLTASHNYPRQPSSVSSLSCSPSTTSSEYIMQSTPSVPYAECAPNCITASLPLDRILVDHIMSPSEVSNLLSDQNPEESFGPYYARPMSSFVHMNTMPFDVKQNPNYF
ncbi:hypothetical protein PHYBLDRAFT_167051 [Phycomyces blakesleeanus NRRL 1555(-)]|uniref:Integrase zinc-binding domain-containing protein n=2 Tax=Phycomyces blakesleeanus TaxID=4837 RepID=A0A162UA44_PHYB8|nr:hypothetical protein PHYBLDRAFT_167051 [Phycomyces blakesleeanus NRRL 1555(-)]OAD74702.1 hypothetical protein PHYBLDRAFT_167051 [Phycomyces blakesleeanus NRRL 1555(-)]|eukprot:XP_018292742.1 hypothetical protein PHYBLDRAFT_167051 [Phycomyces blakesleeanus NRRL 1555(-)]